LKTFYSFYFWLILLIHLAFAHNIHAQATYQQIPIAQKKTPLNEALSQGRVTDILEDERGFIWFATMDGLNRYDGYNVKIFRHNINNTKTISSNGIIKLLEDDKGFIWVLTDNGINKFDPYLEIFYHFDSPSLHSNFFSINDMTIDNKQTLWLGTNSGLFVINSDGKKITPHKLGDFKPYIMSLLADSDDNLWIAYEGKGDVIKYHISTNKYSTLELPYSGDTKYHTIIFHEDENKRIWLITRFINNADLFKTCFIDKKKNKIQKFIQFKDVIIEEELFGSVLSITSFASKNNELWVATTIAGIVKFDLQNNKLIHYPETNIDVKNDWVVEIGKTKLKFDRNENLWIGTSGNGAYLWPKNRNNFNLVNTTLFKESFIQSYRAFCEDDDYYWFGGYFGLSKMAKKDGQITNVAKQVPVYTINNYPGDGDYLLVGSESGGFIKFNKKDGRLLKRNKEFYNKRSEVDDYLIRPYSTLVENDSLVWIGGYNNISRLNFDKSEVKHYCRCNNKWNVLGNIYCIYRDFSGRLWVGSDTKGLAFYADSLDNFVPYITQDSSLGLSNLRINSIAQTSDSSLWAGTSKGLLKFGKHGIHLFTEQDQLPNDFVYGVLVDEEGLLWLSTNNGICCFNPENFIVKSYNVNDGLQDKEFNTAAYFKAKDGRLFFGGVKGFNHFIPSEINDALPKIPIVLTGVKWDGKSVKFSKKELKSSVIKVPAYVDYLRIEFAGLNYINTLGNTYKYKINNDNKWVSLGKNHNIDFHKMLPGVYKLQILVANNSGKWINEPLELKIIVEAYFWETIWFKILSLFIVIILISYTLYSRFKRIKRQKFIVEEEVKSRTNELSISNKNLELAVQTKDKFFSIISHDLKNPLAAAQSVSHELKHCFNAYDAKDQQDMLNIMDSSIVKLNDLLNNLLSWSLLQRNQIVTDFRLQNLRKGVALSIGLLDHVADAKGISIINKIDKDIQVNTDGNIFNTIIRNILSNAIKYTHNGGEIRVCAKLEISRVLIEIVDNGVGISTETIKTLFVPEEILSTTGTNKETGTGLGLILVKDFVKLLGGEIWVESEEGKGSIFIISIPKNKAKH